MAALLLLRIATTTLSSRFVVVVVVVVVGLQDFLAQLFLSLVDICVEFVSVLSDREFLIVVNWDVDLSSADRLILRVVELGYIGVSQGLLCGQSSVRVKLEQVAKKVECVIRGSWEHVS